MFIAKSLCKTTRYEEKGVMPWGPGFEFKANFFFLQVFIANFSAKNPISIDQTVVPKRAALTDGSVLEICGTRFRWKFDDSKLVRKTPTSSKFGNRRRTTMVRKKQPAAAAASGGASSAVAGGSGKKPASKKSLQQKPATYTLPKNNKQLLKNIRKRLTVHKCVNCVDSKLFAYLLKCVYLQHNDQA